MSFIFHLICIFHFFYYTALESIFSNAMFNFDIATLRHPSGSPNKLVILTMRIGYKIMENFLQSGNDVTELQRKLDKA